MSCCQRKLNELAEVIAKNVHEVWSAGHMKDGWTYGGQRNDTELKHPCLVTYEDLTVFPADAAMNPDLGLEVREQSLQGVVRVRQADFRSLRVAAHEPCQMRSNAAPLYTDKVSYPLKRVPVFLPPRRRKERVIFSAWSRVDSISADKLLILGSSGTFSANPAAYIINTFQAVPVVSPCERQRESILRSVPKLFSVLVYCTPFTVELNLDEG